MPATKAVPNEIVPEEDTGQGGLAEVSGRTRLSHDRTEVLHSVDPHRAS